MPRDHPDWCLCYDYYRVWSDHIDPQTGLPLRQVTTANISEKAGEMEMLLVDGGCNRKPFADFAQEHLGAEVEVAKRSEPHTFAAG